MRFLSTKTHAILDYLSGVLFILSPWLFGFEEVETAKWVVIVVGAMIIGMSMLTNYELSVAKQITVSTHLTVDVVVGILLALSPWILGFADQVFWPHLIFGLFEVGAGLITQKAPHASHAAV